MRYRVSPREIIPAIAITLLFAVLSAVATLSLHLENLCTPLVDYTYEKLADGQRMKISIDRVDRTFLTRLVLHDIDIEAQENRILHFDRIKMDRGVLFPLIGATGNPVIVDLELEDGNIPVPDIDFKALSAAPETSPNPLVKPFEKFSYLCNLKSGDLSLSYRKNTLRTGDVSLFLSLKKGLKFHHAGGYLSSLEASDGTRSLTLNSLKFYLDAANNLSLQMPSGVFETPDMKAGLSQVVMTGASSHYKFSLHDGYITSPQMDIDIPLLSGEMEANIRGLNLTYAQLALSAVKGKVAEAEIEMPATTVRVDREGESFHLVSASSKTTPLTGEYKGHHLELENPVFTLDFDRTKNFRFNFSIPSAGYSRNIYKGRFSNLNLDGQGKDLSKCLVTLNGSGSFSRREEKGSGAFSLSLEKENDIYRAHGTFDRLITTFLEFPLYLKGDLEGENHTIRQVNVIGESDPVSLRLKYEKDKEKPFSVHGNLNARNLMMGDMKNLIECYLPMLTPYYDESSFIDANLFVSAESGKGQAVYDIAFNSLKFGRFHFNTGSTARGKIENDTLFVDYMTLGLGPVRAEYTGKIDLDGIKPSGAVTLYNAENGMSLLLASFDNISPGGYSYSATLPSFPKFLLTGELLFSKGDFSGSSLLCAGGKEYPVSLNYTTADQMLKAHTGEEVVLEAFVGNPLTVDMKLNSLILPETELFRHTDLTGALSFTYKDKQHWQFSADRFAIKALNLNSLLYDFAGNLKITPDSFMLTDLIINDSEHTFTGKVSYSGTPLQYNISNRFSRDFAFAFQLGEQGQYATGYLGREGNTLESMIDLKHLDLSRFREDHTPGGLSGKVLWTSDLKNMFSLSGQLEWLGEKLKWGGKAHVTSEKVALSDCYAHTPAFRFDYGNLVLDAPGGTYSGDFSIAAGENRFESSASVLFDGAFDRQNNLLALIPVPENFFTRLIFPDSLIESESSLLAQIKSGRAGTTIHLKDAEVLGTQSPDDLTISLGYKDHILSAEGNLIEGNYNLDSSFINMTLRPVFGAGGFFTGRLLPDNLDLKISDIDFDLRHINLFFSTPMVEMKEGIAHGDIYLNGSFGQPEMRGQVWCDNMAVTTLFFHNSIIRGKNVLLSGDGFSFTSPNTPCFVENTDTGRISRAAVKMEMLLNGFSLDLFRVEVEAPENPIRFYLPIPEIGLEIITDATGKLTLENRAGENSHSTGHAKLENAIVSLGNMKYCPDWYHSGATSCEFTLDIGKNSRFIYPNNDSPVISIILKENQSWNFTFDPEKSEFATNSRMEIRSGEIFYFQKNFYINEGNISFRSVNDSLTPVLNLRARLRDFDPAGNPVDIYLLLKDSTPENLNPSFESSPAMSLEDIMLTLGQNIMPTRESSSLYRMASMVSVATDMAQRFGLIEQSSATNLANSIQNTLNLDILSIHSPILSNIILEAIPGSNQHISPLARYLDNTTIFMGKYISENSFLQATLHMSALESPGMRSGALLSDDLALDLELSWEWNNPLAVCSVFTRPSELSIISIWDTMGFSINKRIVLR